MQSRQSKRSGLSRTIAVTVMLSVITILVSSALALGIVPDPLLSQPSSDLVAITVVIGLVALTLGVGYPLLFPEVGRR